MNAVKLARVEDLYKAASKIIIEISHHSLWKVNYRYPHQQHGVIYEAIHTDYSLPEKHQNNRNSGIKSLEARMHTIKIYAPTKIVNQDNSLLP